MAEPEEKEEDTSQQTQTQTAPPPCKEPETWASKPSKAEGRECPWLLERGSELAQADRPAVSTAAAAKARARLCGAREPGVFFCRIPETQRSETKSVVLLVACWQGPALFSVSLRLRPPRLRPVQARGTVEEWLRYVTRCAVFGVVSRVTEVHCTSRWSVSLRTRLLTAGHARSRCEAQCPGDGSG